MADLGFPQFALRAGVLNHGDTGARRNTEEGIGHKDTNAQKGTKERFRPEPRRKGGEYSRSFLWVHCPYTGSGLPATSWQSLCDPNVVCMLSVCFLYVFLG